MYNLNNYYGFPHCKLLNPKITPDGYFKGIIVDYYDFEKRLLNSIGAYANNWGYSMSSDAISNETFFGLFILFLIIPIIYILSSILITKFAIKNRWSIYLDRFFNNKKLTTLIFFLSILVIYFYYILDNWIWNYLLYCFTPTYVIIYITVMYITIKKNYYR